MASAEGINFLSALLPLAVAVFIIAIGVIFLNEHFRRNLYRQMLEQEELKSRHQKELLRSSIAVQENEQKRIAKDLHDEMGAVLSIARMQLVQLEKQNRDDKNLSEALRRVRSDTEAAIATMRRISHQLMPPQLEKFGLVATLDSIVTDLNSGTQIAVALHAIEDQERWPWNVEISLYRVCMELINNTLKHAHAKQISITLTHDNQHYIVQYADDGIGFPAKPNMSGLGLTNIEARVNSVGGVLSMSNGKSGGVFVEIRIPY